LPVMLTGDRTDFSLVCAGWRCKTFCV